MFNHSFYSIEIPQPHFNFLRDGSEITEDSITIGQIILVWLVTIAAIAVFFAGSTISVNNVIQPMEPDPVVQSDLCFLERYLDPVVINGYYATADSDPLSITEHCYVRFF